MRLFMELFGGLIAHDIIDDIDRRTKKYKLANKMFNKLVGFIFMVMLLGPIYLLWIFGKWTIRLTWKLMKLMFRRKRA